MDNQISEFKFYYKGYFTICTPRAKDNNRLYGRIYDETEPQKPLKDWAFAADNPEEAENRFQNMVEKVIQHDAFKNLNNNWKQNVDSKTIGIVFDIMPEEFRARIESKQYDPNIIEKVIGGNYEVPLYYVTKAWDVLLKGSIGSHAFMIGPEEDEIENYESELELFMHETGATRTRQEAIKQNDEMKILWKQFFSIDIDALDIDFKKFDMHLEPKVSEDEYYEYFQEVPDGVVEWIMQGINQPKGDCTFDSVSCLMEFVALIEREREEDFLY